LFRRRWLVSCLVGALWLGLWQTGYYLVDEPLILPSPYGVMNRLSQLILEPDFLVSVLWSVFRVLLSLLISAVLGMVLGASAYFSRTVRVIISPAMLAIKSAPVVSFIVLVILWVRSDWVPVVIAMLMCLPVIWGNVIQGLGAVDERLLEMASLYGVDRTRVLKGLYLKAVLPYLSAALLTCLGLGFKATVTAEVLSSPRYAIGYRLYASKFYLDTEETFAWTLVILLLSLLIEVWLRRVLTRRQKKVGAV
jgi:NitT/TauT family transport system permease protein